MMTSKPAVKNGKVAPTVETKVETKAPKPLGPRLIPFVTAMLCPDGKLYSVDSCIACEHCEGTYSQKDKTTGVLCNYNGK
jgi:hypothetical protein